MVTVVKTSELAGVSREDAWRAVVEFESYATYMPDVISVKVERLEENYWTSDWAIMLDGIEFTWEEKDFLEPPHRLGFELIEGDVEELGGEWSIEETADGCRVTLSMQFDLGIPSMASTLDPLASRALEANVEGLLQGVARMVRGEAPAPKSRRGAARNRKRAAHPPIFLNEYAVRTGEATPLGELQEMRDRPDLAGLLRERGLRDVACFTSREEAFAAMRGVVNEVLGRSGRSPEDIEAIFFTTGCLTWRLADDQALLHSLGLLDLGQCSLIGVNMGSCANTGTAFRVAQSVMASEQLDTALLVTLDWVDPVDKRLSAPDIGMNADGASACLLTRDEGPYSVIDSFNCNDARLSDDDLPVTDPTMHLDLHIKGIATLLRETLDLNGLAGKDLDLVLVPNLNQSLTQLVAAAVGMKRAKVLAPNIGTTAHVQTSDALLNLDTAFGNAPPQPGTLILLVCSGPQAWSCTLLKAELNGPTATDGAAANSAAPGPHQSVEATCEP